MPQQRKTTRAPSPKLLQRVAELRAQGLSWAQVAVKTRRKPETIRCWPWRYKEQWKLIYRQAEKLEIENTTAMSRSILKSQFISDDEKIKNDAAGRLLTYSLALGRKTTTGKKAKVTLNPAMVRMAEYLQGLNNEDLAAFTQAVTPGPVVGACRGGTDDPPGAA